MLSGVSTTSVSRSHNVNQTVPSLTTEQAQSSQHELDPDESSLTAVDIGPSAVSTYSSQSNNKIHIMYLLLNRPHQVTHHFPSVSLRKHLTFLFQ